MDALKRLSELVDDPEALFAGIGAALFGLGGFISGAIDGLHAGGYIGALLYGIGLGVVGALLGALIGWFFFYALAIGALILLVKGVIWVIHSLWGIGRP